MQTIKPQSLSCSSRPVPGLGGQTQLVVTVMAGFEMHGSMPVLSSDQNFWKALVPVLPTKTAPDLGFTKPRAEWLAFGYVYPAQPQATTALAQVTMTRDGRSLINKSILVSGERRWLSRSGIAWPPEPQVITKPVKLDWINAFGGKGHVTNPSGVGIYSDSWSGQLMPQIEYADQLIASPLDRPVPAGFGPIPLDALERFKPFGTFDARWKKEDYPALPKDTPPEVLMLAPADQRLEGWFEPGDVFTCEGMTPDGKAKRWILPDWQPRCFIRRTPQGSKLLPVEMVADTVMLIPHKGLLGLMWRGAITVSESDAHDVSLLFAALEDRHSPKPIYHYEDQLAIRSGAAQDAVLACLDESPLLPAGQFGSILPAIPQAARVKINSVLKAATAAREQAQQKAALPGSEPAPQDSRADEATQISNEMVEILTSPNPDQVKLAKLVKRARELGAKARQMAIEKIQEINAAHGVDVKSASEKKIKDMFAGPPSRRAPALHQALEKSLDQSELSVPQRNKLRDGVEKLLQTATKRYRKSVHWMDTPSPLAEPKDMGERIVAHLHANSGLAAHPGSDWVGADLSGYQLDGVNLTEVFLDGASFVGTSLIGANFTRATLAGANFSGANLRGANFTGANLGKANLTGANLEGAILDRAVLDQAILDHASFQSAQLKGATLIGVIPGSVDLSNANMSSCKLLGLKIGSELDPAEVLKDKALTLDSIIKPIDVSRINASSVYFHKATIIGCYGVGSKFTKADFLSATLAHCDLKESDFSQANFTSTNIVLKSNLARSNFNNAKIHSSFLKEVDLHASDMRGADLRKSYFGMANMEKVNAINSCAANTRFDRANLVESSFASSKMTAAVFTGSNISGTSFDDATLTYADFNKAKADTKTSFKDAATMHAKLDFNKKGG